MYKMYIITHNSRHRFVLSLLKLKKEEELKNSKRRRKEIWGNVALFRFMFVNFCLNFFLPDFCVMYCASCAFVFLFVPLFVSVFVDWRRQRGKEEQKKRTQSLPSGNRTNATDVCLCLFFFITWWRCYSEWEEHDMAGDTNVAVRRGFTVQRVHRTQCRLVCTRRDLGDWAGPVGQVGAGPVGGWGWWSIRCLDTSARPQVESQ